VNLDYRLATNFIDLTQKTSLLDALTKMLEGVDDVRTLEVLRELAARLTQAIKEDPRRMRGLRILCERMSASEPMPLAA